MSANCFAAGTKRPSEKAGATSRPIPPEMNYEMLDKALRLLGRLTYIVVDRLRFYRDSSIFLFLSSATLRAR